MIAGSGAQCVRALKISPEIKTKKAVLRFVCKGENSMRGILRLKVAGRLFLLPGNLWVFYALGMLLQVSCCGNPRYGMRRVLEPRAPQGSWQSVPVPKGQPFLYQQRGRWDGLQERAPQLSHIQALFRPTITRCVGPHSLPSHSGCL